MDWGPIAAAIITALLSSSVIGALIAYFANRGKNRADAAATNVETAIRLRDEAEESRKAALAERAAAVADRLEAIEARDAAQAVLDETLKKLAYLEGQGVTELRKELNDAKQRITALEETVKKLQNELSLSKARETKLRQRLNRIKGELDTGPLD
jgi:predicted RNase H-like nuclease (RuvC/YqgF family)